MTSPALEQVRLIAVSIEDLMRQLVHYSSLESVGACLELRQAAAALAELVADPPALAGPSQPLPLADIADAIRYQLRLVDALTADVRLEIPIVAAHSHLQLAGRYLR